VGRNARSETTQDDYGPEFVAPDGGRSGGKLRLRALPAIKRIAPAKTPEVAVTAINALLEALTRGV